MSVIRYTEEQKQEVIRLHASGRSRTEIQDETGITITTISRWLAAANYPPGVKNKLTPEQVNEILDLYKQGLTYQEIAARFAVSRQAIHLTVKKHQKDVRQAR